MAYKAISKYYRRKLYVPVVRAWILQSVQTPPCKPRAPIERLVQYHCEWLQASEFHQQAKGLPLPF